jgi:hypothetical protein
MTSDVRPGRPAAKVVDSSATSDSALSLASKAGHRVHNRPTPIRLWFVQRRSPGDPPPPLARMLRGGRGGEVRLKLYLSLLWLAAGGEHDVHFAPHTYARLLDLEDPYGRGARRINDGLNWLAKERFISLERKPGHEPTVTLRSDAGSGEPYVKPGRAPKDPTTGKASPDNVYVQLAVEFWLRGWAASLSASAIAMLLILLVLARDAGKDDELWISPDEALARYDLSEDTRARGFRALEEAGLVVVGRRPVNPDFGWRRVRNTYTLFRPALELGAARTPVATT